MDGAASVNPRASSEPAVEYRKIFICSGAVGFIRPTRLTRGRIELAFLIDASQGGSGLPGSNPSRHKVRGRATPVNIRPSDGASDNITFDTTPRCLAGAVPPSPLAVPSERFYVPRSERSMRIQASETTGSDGISEERSMTRLAALVAAGVTVSAAAATLAPATMAAQSYRPVTDERLVSPEPENWLSYRGDYNGWGYSLLDQIDATNVQHLSPVWAFSTNTTEGHESRPSSTME